jgi:hypothetical protein
MSDREASAAKIRQEQAAREAAAASAREKELQGREKALAARERALRAAERSLALSLNRLKIDQTMVEEEKRFNKLHAEHNQEVERSLREMMDAMKQDDEESKSGEDVKKE